MTWHLKLKGQALEELKSCDMVSHWGAAASNSVMHRLPKVNRTDRRTEKNQKPNTVSNKKESLKELIHLDFIQNLEETHLLDQIFLPSKQLDENEALLSNNTLAQGTSAGYPYSACETSDPSGAIGMLHGLTSIQRVILD